MTFSSHKISVQKSTELMQQDTEQRGLSGQCGVYEFVSSSCWLHAGFPLDLSGFSPTMVLTAVL